MKIKKIKPCQLCDKVSANPYFFYQRRSRKSVKGGLSKPLFDDWFGSPLELLSRRLDNLGIKLLFVRKNEVENK